MDVLDPVTAREIERNKAVVNRFVAEIFVAGRADAVDELVAEDFVPHSWPSTGDPRDMAPSRYGPGPADTVSLVTAHGDGPRRRRRRSRARRLAVPATAGAPGPGLRPTGARPAWRLLQLSA